MSPLRYTLIADGPTDQALLPIINWLLDQIPKVANAGFTPQFADPGVISLCGADLSTKVLEAIRRFPCDTAFIHRDAEKEGFEVRLAEIQEAIRNGPAGSFVPIIPVRMTEAWLLIDEQSIRLAADNPNGSVELNLPPIGTLEQLPDPKSILNNLLIKASEKSGRRRGKFSRPSELAWRRVRVAQLIDNFSPLRRLNAFLELERETRQILSS